MDELTAANRSAPAITNLTSFFMIAPETFAKGAELGFSGLDFYVTGRGGALGDVDADVVAAAFLFFEPAMVRSQWELGRAVMPPLEAARGFASCLTDWTEANVPADLDTTRLTELAHRLVSTASPAGAPLFAGWRSNIVAPTGPAAATFLMNALRELRNAFHGIAIINAGLTMQQAVSHRSPQMSGLFGWGDPIDTSDVEDVWADAEAATDRAMARIFTVLDESEREEFTEAAAALLQAVS